VGGQRSGCSGEVLGVRREVGAKGRIEEASRVAWCACMSRRDMAGGGGGGGCWDVTDRCTAAAAMRQAHLWFG